MKFLTDVDLKHHVNSRHRFRCSLCPRIFSQQSFLDQHMETPHEDSLRCHTCKEVYHSQSSFNQHQRSRQSSECVPKTYDCTYGDCKMSLLTPPALEIHMGQHTGIHEHKCQKCTRSFDKKKDFRTHQLLHIKFEHAPVQFLCKKCAGLYGSQARITDHRYYGERARSS